MHGRKTVNQKSEVKTEDMLRRLMKLNEKNPLFAIDNKQNTNNRHEPLTEIFKKNMDVLIKSYVLINFSVQNFNLKGFMNEFEKKLIEYALQFSLGNQKKAALLLGVKKNTLFEKIRKYKIRKIDYKQILNKEFFNYIKLSMQDC